MTNSKISSEAVLALVKDAARQYKELCDLKKELHETRLALYMLEKVFRKAEKTSVQEKYHKLADEVIRKYFKISDVLRNQKEDQQ